MGLGAHFFRVDEMDLLICDVDDGKDNARSSSAVSLISSAT